MNYCFGNIDKSIVKCIRWIVQVHVKVCFYAIIKNIIDYCNI